MNITCPSCKIEFKERKAVAMELNEFAAMLNGRERGHEITADEEIVAQRAGLVVMFGASDDLVELRGAISDEVNATEGCTLYFKDGALIPELDDETEIETLAKHGVLEIVQKAHHSAVKIEALWCDGAEPEYAWTFRTTVPHAVFDVMEYDHEKFCLGIVVHLSDLNPTG